jgi:hypothetical protein
MYFRGSLARGGESTPVSGHVLNGVGHLVATLPAPWTKLDSFDATIKTDEGETWDIRIVESYPLEVGKQVRCKFNVERRL